MGYKPKKTIYKLDFSDTELAGLEAAVRAGSIDQLLGLQELADHEELSAQQAREMFAGFAELLVSWNVETEDDRPVPVTYEGVASQEPDFIKEIIAAFYANVAAAPPPLPGASPSGGSSPGELTAAAALSSSLPSS
ncbi:MAG TPA: hypothetical protein VIL16_12560 [Trebonia sp.]